MPADREPTDAELETLLRRTFAARREDVRHGPDASADLLSGASRGTGSRAHEPRSRRRWLAAAAAAGVLVALTATVVGLRTGHRAADGPQALCRTSMPASWDAAIGRGRIELGRPGWTISDPVAPDATGGAAVGLTRAGHRPEVAYVTTGGTVRHLYTADVAAADDVSVYSDGRSVVVDIAHRPEPNYTSLTLQLVMIDLTTGARHTLARTSLVDGHHTRTPVDAAGFVGGDFYWTMISADGHTVTLHRSTADGTSTRVGSHVRHGATAVDAVATPRGVYWHTEDDRTETATLAVPVRLPTIVASGVAGTHDPLTASESIIGDGRSYAWFPGSGERIDAVSYWRPGLRHATTYAVPRSFGNPFNGISGPYVEIFFGSEALERAVIDMRTGALAEESARYELQFGGPRFVYATDQDRHTTLYRAPLDRLPALRC